MCAEHAHTHTHMRGKGLECYLTVNQLPVGRGWVAGEDCPILTSLCVSGFIFRQKQK